MNRNVLVIADLETTGLDPRSPGANILEMSFLVVRIVDLQVIDSVSYVVRPPVTLAWCEAALHPSVIEMHTKSGLFAECFSPNAEGLAAVAARCEQFLLDAGAADAVLVGARPDFDRDWLAEHCPRLLSCLHYRNIDVNSFWLVDTLCCGRKQDKPPQAHRALADCRAALALLRTEIGRRRAVLDAGDGVTGDL